MPDVSNWVFAVPAAAFLLAGFAVWALFRWPDRGWEDFGEGEN